MDQQYLKKISLNNNQIKIIAFFSMLLDHIGVLILKNQNIFFEYKNLAVLFRLIGRIAFPIYSFLFLEAFFKSKSIKKYAIRLFIFAIISEIPFDLFFFNKIIEFSHQNILFNFFLILILLSLIKRNEKNKTNIVLYIIIFSMISYFLKLDYYYIAVIFISILYIYRDNYNIKIIYSFIVLITQFPAILGFLLFKLYNFKKGKINIKILFYLLYPLHFIILYILEGIFISK